MSLLVKITLSAALILSIAVPFGAFAAGERTKGRYKTCLLYTSRANHCEPEEMEANVIARYPEDQRPAMREWYTNLIQ